MPRTRKPTTGARKKKSNPGGARTAKSRSNSPARKKTARGTVAAARAKPSAGAAREPEMRRGASGMETATQEYVNVSDETAGILSVVKGLEEQIDTAFELKEALEADLDATQDKLSQELTARVELEAQVQILQSQAALVEQLQQDISFSEEERNRFAGLLAEIQPQFQATTEERNTLTEQLASAEAHAKELQDDKTALEAQVMNLKDKVADTKQLRADLTEAAGTQQELNNQVQDLSSRLETSETSKNALETELAGAQQTVRSLGEEAEDLRVQLADALKHLGDLRADIQQQQAVNTDLIETRRRLQGEVKRSNVDYVATKTELDTIKKALRDIRSEAALASGRVRQRYFKPKYKE